MANIDQENQDIIESNYLRLAKLVKEDLDEQFTKNRIKGAEYATVYSNLMSTILQLSFQAPKQDHEICRIDAERENIIRRTANFDDEILAKLLDVQYRGWSEAFKSGLLEDIPSILKNDELSELYHSERERITKAEWRNNNKCGLDNTGDDNE